MPKPVTNMMDQTITSVSREHRIFRPSAEFQRQANLGSLSAYKKLYEESVNSPEKFWRREAEAHLVWRKRFTGVLKWTPPHAKWFMG
jgi:acetyl-CoA synthetase